tara:strand:- start:2231 stop:3520 length:1290 start_codon:yes stop_codon:yes gene_type:complete
MHILGIGNYIYQYNNMKKHIIFIAVITLNLISYSQNDFKNGYFIDNNNQKISCLIRTIDWYNNPIQFTYKITDKSDSKKADIKAVKEFGFKDESLNEDVIKYIRAVVNIDRSSELLDKLSKQRNPIFKEEELFLKVLVEGKSNLYQYIDNSVTRYFYTTDDLKIEQLVYKIYLVEGDAIAKNIGFRQQLLSNLKCPDFSISKIKKLDYFRKELVNFFIEYSECFDHSVVDYSPKKNKSFFNLSIRPRINNSSLSIVNEGFNAKDKIEFDNETGFGIGAEAEVILPYQKYKWSIIVEPSYHSYKSETINTDVSVIFGGTIESKIDYTSIEIPVGFRHYFFLNKNSKIFINASVVFDLETNSSITFNRSDSSNDIILKTNSQQNYAFGIGYKYNKFSVEARYQTKRELIWNNRILNSEYKSFSFILGYSIF